MDKESQRKQRAEREPGFGAFYRKRLPGMIALCLAIVVADCVSSRAFDPLFCVIALAICGLLPAVKWALK
ncbi:MAG TPA: hypothetical protein IAC25_05425 [Candidatus Enterenecus stercoripullorum]|nr:hypothetical protein [Candidatus Enterenecus stercoripullorum]